MSKITCLSRCIIKDFLYSFFSESFTIRKQLNIGGKDGKGGNLEALGAKQRSSKDKQAVRYYSR